MSTQTLPTASSSHQNKWAGYSKGSVIYAEVVEVPDAVYIQEMKDGLPDTWLKIENPLIYEGALEVNDHHLHLDKGHIIRIQVYDETWGQILPDGYYSPYLPDSRYFYPAYIDLKYLRPLAATDFDPITIYPTTQNADKLIILILDETPRLVLFEGKTPVLHVPVILGSILNTGDFRIHRTRVSDDLSDIAAVPYSNHFTGDYAFHGSPWWNWREVIRGGYGGYGFVNLPDQGWYTIQVNDAFISVTQWVYRWISSNLDYDESDSTLDEARIFSTDTRWYQGTGSVRVMVVEYVEDLNEKVPTWRLGDEASVAQVRSWEEIITAYQALNGHWLITHLEDTVVTSEKIASEKSIAQQEGNSDSLVWIMLDCVDRSQFDLPAYEGSVWTVGDACYHLAIERQGSICTPERGNLDFLGKRVLCDQRRFYSKHISERGHIITHEKVHLIQFAGYFDELARQGISADDPSPTEIDVTQFSIIGVTELMAQTHNEEHSLYAEDYTFALAVSDGQGGVRAFNNWATTTQAWEHLHRECGDPLQRDSELQILLERALMGEKEAYLILEERCSLLLHRLIPDRYRSGD